MCLNNTVYCVNAVWNKKQFIGKSLTISLSLWNDLESHKSFLGVWQGNKRTSYLKRELLQWARYCSVHTYIYIKYYCISLFNTHNHYTQVVKPSHTSSIYREGILILTLHRNALSPFTHTSLCKVLTCSTICTYSPAAIASNLVSCILAKESSACSRSHRLNHQPNHFNTTI